MRIAVVCLILLAAIVVGHLHISGPSLTTPTVPTAPNLLRVGASERTILSDGDRDLQEPHASHENPLSDAEASDLEVLLAKRDALLNKLPRDSVIIGVRANNLVALEQGFHGLSDIRYEPEGSWEPILDVIRPLVPFVGTESVEFLSDQLGGGDGKLLFVFEQRINGIPVDGSRLKLWIDEDSGEIVKVNSSLIPDLGFHASPNIGADEAVHLAEYAARLEKPATSGEIHHTKPRLVYLRHPSSTRVDLVWQFGIGPKMANVNAVTGEVSFSRRFIASPDKVSVCNLHRVPVDNQWDIDGIVEQCTENATNGPLFNKVFIKGQCAESHPDCSVPLYADLKDGASHAEDILTTGSPNFNLGDVIINANIDLDQYNDHGEDNDDPGASGAFDRSSGEILTEGTLELSSKGERAALIGHEISHRVWQLNGLPSGPPVSNAINEGMAEVFAVYVRARTTQSPPVFSSVATNTQITQQSIYNPSDPTGHANGVIVENLFWRVSETSGVSVSDMEKLISKTYSNIDDDGGTVGIGAGDGHIDFPELVEGMLEGAANISSTVYNAVIAAQQAVGISVQIPPPNTSGGSWSPILIDLDQDGFNLGEAGVYVQFDFNGDWIFETSQWVAKDEKDVFLALDHNANGRIDSGLELFGDSTWLPLLGRHARHGYEGLAQYDSPKMGGNGDGRISADDPIWLSLLLWHDRDADGRSSSSELSRIEESHLMSMSTTPRRRLVQDDAGNWLPLWGWARGDFSSGRQVKHRTVDVFFRQSESE